MSPVARDRMLDGLRRRNPDALAAIARRSTVVTLGKKLLPVAAVALLVALALAPSWQAGPEQERVTYHVRHRAGETTPRACRARSIMGWTSRGSLSP